MHPRIHTPPPSVPATGDGGVFCKKLEYMGEKMQVTPLKGKKMGGLKAANAYFC